MNICWQLLGSLLSLFPFSFISFVFSERTLITHQSRVGMGQTFKIFLSQSWCNIKALFFKGTQGRSIFVLAAQFSLLATIPYFEMNAEELALNGGILICLVLGLVYLTISDFGTSAVEKRIQNDQKTIQALMGSVLAMICIFSCYALSGKWNLAEIMIQQKDSPLQWGIFWSPVQFIFFILFQISGMLVFGEHPFSTPFFEQGRVHALVGSSWLESARFYVWSMIAASLFFGGKYLFDDSEPVIAFLVLQIKAALIYVFFRLVALYFPHHSHSETLRATFLFLIPIALAVLLFVFIFHGMVGVNA